MNEKRLEVILNNVLVELLKAIELEREDYIQWLKHEVGITDEELKKLNLPMPD